jgi:hypothetical protein
VGSAARLFGGEAHVAGAAEFGFIDDADHDAGAGIFVDLDDHRDVFFLGEAADEWSHTTDADFAAAMDDLAFGGDGDEDAIFLELDGGGGLGFVDFDAGFLDEGGGDDEEEQEDENHVDQGEMLISETSSPSVSERR